jgi:hypothetical protein
MRQETAAEIIAAMRAICPKVDDLTPDGIDSLTREIEHIGLPPDRVMLIINARTMHHRSGHRYPTIGDIIAELRLVANSERQRAAPRSDPRNWHPETKRELAAMHEQATGRDGPRGALLALILAARIDERRMIAMIDDARRQARVRRPFDESRLAHFIPQVAGGVFAQMVHQAREIGYVETVDTAAACEHMVGLIIELVRAAGGDPEQIIEDSKKFSRHD